MQQIFKTSCSNSITPVNTGVHLCRCLIADAHEFITKKLTHTVCSTHMLFVYTCSMFSFLRSDSQWSFARVCARVCVCVFTYCLLTMPQWHKWWMPPQQGKDNRVCCVALRPKGYKHHLNWLHMGEPIYRTYSFLWIQFSFHQFAFKHEINRISSNALIWYIVLISLRWLSGSQSSDAKRMTKEGLYLLLLFQKSLWSKVQIASNFCFAPAMD